MPVTWNVSLPANRSTGDKPTGGVASDVNALKNAITELRTQVATLSGGETPASVAPSSISGLALWLDSTQISGATDGAALATWPDMSGNSRNATQSTAASRPIYRSTAVSGVTLPNGKPVVVFDGVDDSFTGALFTQSQPVTTFCVLARGNSPYTQVDFDLRTNGSSGGFMQRVGEGAGNRFHLYAGETYFSVADAPTAYSLTTIQWNTTSSILRVDGVQSGGSFNPGSNGVNGGYVVGRYADGANYAMQRFASLLVYNRLLNSTEIGQVESYLKSKFGTP